MDNTNLVPSYRNLLTDIGQLLQQARQQVASAVNTTMLTTYWTIGQYIVEFEQQGNERAEYGSDLINRLSHDLTERYGKGFSKSNLLYIRKLYITFPISETVSHLLTWSHYFEILKLDDPLEMNYYRKEMNVEGDNEPIGIVLGANKDQLMMQYALQGITNQLFVAKYQLYLPSREELQSKLYEILNRQSE